MNKFSLVYIDVKGRKLMQCMLIVCGIKKSSDNYYQFTSTIIAIDPDFAVSFNSRFPL